MFYSYFTVVSSETGAVECHSRKHAQIRPVKPMSVCNLIALIRVHTHYALVKREIMSRSERIPGLNARLCSDDGTHRSVYVHYDPRLRPSAPGSVERVHSVRTLTTAVRCSGRAVSTMQIYVLRKLVK